MTVVRFPGAEPQSVSTDDDVLPVDVLADAHEANLSQVVVIGWDGNGDFFSSGTLDSAETHLMLLEVAKRALLDGVMIP